MAGEDGRLKCEECGVEFTPPEQGGVCILCLQPYCQEHLAPPGDVGPLCNTCGGGR